MGRNSRSADAHPEPWPDPATMRTTAAFFCGLKKVRAWSGRSFTELAAHSKELGYPLARSTIHKLCSDKEENKKLPATFARIEHLLLTCGVPADRIGPWKQAYHRLNEASEVVAVEQMPVGEVGEFVPTFGPEYDRPSITWLAATFLTGTAVGGALVAWLL
ncbi:hypothetical protein LFM09_11785 [Lentzea alba]|uniref:hypothetical protein n=1 Tax=Lentzea alba TaxID=2714351 RepID=UPI0039BFB22B